uniref:Tegument protein UL35 n=1 Tax=Cardioderma bat herpesvirus TaxID=3141914 RepID=A0AAU7E229_9VIRU
MASGRAEQFEWEEVSDPQDFKPMSVNDQLNFNDGFLERENLQYILRRLLHESSFQTVGTFNAGLPISAHDMEARLDIHINPKACRVRQIAEMALEVAVMANSYYNSKDVLLETISSVREAYSGETKERLDSAFRRLVRASGSPLNPHYILEIIGRHDLPKGAYIKHLEEVYDVMSRVHISASNAAKDLYPNLVKYNLIYRAPKFTTVEAVQMYASNMRNLTHQRERGLKLLTAEKDTRDPVETANDIMYMLSMTNLMLMHQDELAVLKKWTVIKMSEICAAYYMCYLQVPESKDLYMELVDSVCAVMNTNISEPEDAYALSFPVNNMLRFVRFLDRSGVYALPSFFKFNVFAVMIRTHNVLSEHREEPRSDDEDDFAGDTSSDEEGALEIDPRSSSEIGYMVKNPFGKPDLYRCPKNLVKYIKTELLTSQPIQQIITDRENNEIKFEQYTLDYIDTIMVEGSAKQLKMDPRQVMAYVSTVTEGADVADDGRDEEDSTFANVRVRRPPSHGAEGGVRSASRRRRNQGPYSRPPQQQQQHRSRRQRRRDGAGSRDGEEGDPRDGLSTLLRSTNIE